MRDSFYLLSVMNQYTIKHVMPTEGAEKLLRIALFSDSLQLEVVEDESRSLVKRRRKMARSIREARKKGVVPVFISLLWFLFSLAISIQAGKSLNEAERGEVLIPAWASRRRLSIVMSCYAYKLTCNSLWPVR